MTRPVITTPVRPGRKTFRRFAFYDALRARHKARRPLLFSLIRIPFAFAALFSREQSGPAKAFLIPRGQGDVPCDRIGDRPGEHMNKGACRPAK